MSAIWGVIDLQGNDISDSEIESLKKPFAKCRLDRIEEKRNKNIYLGCGIQYFTTEAHYEVLPILNTEDEFFLDADVMIDNRDELFERLGIADAKEMIPDGTLLMMMLKKFGDKCLNDILGAYSFVYKSKETGSVNLVVDAVGSRCVYYYTAEGKVYFASLIEPLALIKKEISVNERWITDFIALDCPIIFTDGEETSINGINRVAPGQIVSITSAGIHKTSYWTPFEKLKELKYNSDEEYKNHFRKVFHKAVTCLLRSDEETGILLSGGLDSTAVASIAAAYLKEKNKKLYSFTSIPEEDYVADKQSIRITNEREAVNKTKNIINNLETNFMDLPGANPWKERKKQMEIQEMPYKSVYNSLWLYEGMEEAYQKNARIMLNGAAGNSGISFGSLEFYFDILFASRHYMKLWKEITYAQKRYHYSRKKVVRSIITEYSGRRKAEQVGISEKAFIKPEKIKEYSADIRLGGIFSVMAKAQWDYSYKRKLLCDIKHLRQIGESEAKRSLYTGVIVRDPTRDKRIIEFCLSLPLEQFAKNGEDRRLIRVYLADLMPEHVVKNYKVGQQGADLVYKMNRYWEETRMEWLEEYDKYKDSSLIDCQKAIKELEEGKEIENYKEADLVRHMHTLMALEYIEAIQSRV